MCVLGLARSSTVDTLRRQLTPGRQLEPTCGACMHPLLQTHQRPGFPTWLRLQLVEGGREGGLRPVILQSGGPFGGCVLYCLVGVAFVARWWLLASEVRSFGVGTHATARWARAISHHLCVFGNTYLVCYGTPAARFGLCVSVCVPRTEAVSVDDGRPPSSRA